MKTYLFDTFNRYKRLSEKLDVTTTLCNKTWNVFNDSGEKEIYIFQEDGSLIISLNGMVTSANWKFISANKSLIINTTHQAVMLHPAFMDSVIFSLQLDGTENYAFLIEEGNKGAFQPKTLSDVKNYFSDKLHKAELKEKQTQIEDKRIKQLAIEKEKQAQIEKEKKDKAFNEEYQRWKNSNEGKRFLLKNEIKKEMENILANDLEYEKLMMKYDTLKNSFFINYGPYLIIPIFIFYIYLLILVRIGKIDFTIIFILPPILLILILIILGILTSKKSKALKNCEIYKEKTKVSVENKFGII